MTSHVLKRLPTTIRVRDALATAVGTGFKVGLSGMPTIADPATAGATLPAPPPYFIVYPLWIVLDDNGWSEDRHVDADWTYQITVIAQHGDQLEYMRDKVVDVFFGKAASGGYAVSLDVSGAKVIDRTLADDSGGDPTPGAMPSSNIRVRLRATAADTVPVP